MDTEKEIIELKVNLRKLELQIEAAKAQAFAQGYIAALKYVAKKAQGEPNGKSKLESRLMNSKSSETPW